MGMVLGFYVATDMEVMGPPVGNEFKTPNLYLT